MTVAVTAKGIRLFVKQQTAWKEFLEVSAVPEVGESAEKIDVTHLTSEMKEYVKDIPDWSSDLEFTMNAMPSKTTNSNLDLVTTLAKTPNTTYEWKIVYTQLLTQVTVKGQMSYRIGAGAVSSKQDLILTIVPNSTMTVGEITDVASINYNG
nr:MAG TPA: tail tube protein [Caudoviricetes sp.]